MLAKGERNYIKMGKIILELEAARGVERGTIALMGDHRKALGKSNGDDIRVEKYRPNTTARHMLISVKTFPGKRKPEMKADEFETRVRKLYEGQVFTQQQKWYCDYQDTFLILKIEEIQAIDQKAAIANATQRKGETRELYTYVSEALLTRDTLIKFKSKDFKFEESKKSLIGSDFNFNDMGIGGLNSQFKTIFRRAFSSRLLSTDVVRKLGVEHVKGMLLYGPPGCGKTLIARKIGQMLNAKKPKIVNGPSILSKYVGESEENIRKLFKEAIADEKKLKDKSDLHIIILDEIDAICKQRGSYNSGSAAQDNVVNQFLAMIDGVDALNNILVIGMTNRKDLLDDALLRPGRLEVHVEIGLPNEEGRLQILSIHTKQLKLSQALGQDVSIAELAQKSKNFSGAEIKGLVRNATTYATQRVIDLTSTGSIKMGDAKQIQVRRGDFIRALEECKKQQAFGVEEDDLKNEVGSGLIDTGAPFALVQKRLRELVAQIRDSKATRLLSVLLRGRKGSGKTALAAALALESKLPFVKLISPDRFVGMSERQRDNAINKTFLQAYRSPLSLIILDNLERLLDYVPIGPRFSNSTLQTLLVLINKIPPQNKMMVIATATSDRVLRQLGLADAFMVGVEVPMINSSEEVTRVLRSPELKLSISDSETQRIASDCPLPISVKRLIFVIEMTRVACGTSSITAAEFAKRMADTGARAAVDLSALDD